MYKSIWFVDKGRIGRSTTGTGIAAEAEFGVGSTGIGHPWIKEDWFVKDPFIGALTRNFRYNSTGDGRGFPLIMSARVGMSPIEINIPWSNEYGVNPQQPSAPTELEGPYTIEYNPNTWRTKYLNFPRWPSSAEFEELLSKLDGAGNPYWIKFIKDGLTAEDLETLLGTPWVGTQMAGGVVVPPLIKTGTYDWFLDFSTKIAAPTGTTDDGLPNYDINIKSVFNHYSPLFEEELPESGLNELAMPNYYMMYYAPNNPTDSIAIPPVYRRQITLGDRFAWDHGPVDELTPANYDAIINPSGPSQPDSGYYNRFLETVLNLTSADADDINSDMERYRDIAVRPRSVNWLREVAERTETDFDGGSGGSTFRREVKSKLPAYVEINFHGNPGTPAAPGIGGNLDTRYAGKGMGLLPDEGDHRVGETILDILAGHDILNFFVTAIINADSKWRDAFPGMATGRAGEFFRDQARAAFVYPYITQEQNPRTAAWMGPDGIPNTADDLGGAGNMNILNELKVSVPNPDGGWGTPGNVTFVEDMRLLFLALAYANDPDALYAIYQSYYPAADAAFIQGLMDSYLEASAGNFGMTNPDRAQRLKYMKGPIGTFLIDSQHSTGLGGNDFQPYGPGEWAVWSDFTSIAANTASTGLTKQLKDKIESLTRTYADILNAHVAASLDGAGDSKLCYSETFVYKIEKRVVPEGMTTIPANELNQYSPLQIFYIANDGTQSFKYIDSQVIYGKKYQYDIKEMRLVIGNLYGYGGVTLTSEYVGTGAAVGNALGFYRPVDTPTTPGPFQLADVPPSSQDYLDPGQDVPMLPGTGPGTFNSATRGHFIFKIAKQISQPPGGIFPGDYLNHVQIKLVKGSGVVGNSVGGALPVDAPLGNEWTGDVPDLSTGAPTTGGGFVPGVGCSEEHFREWLEVFFGTDEQWLALSNSLAARWDPRYVGLDYDIFRNYPGGDDYYHQHGGLKGESVWGSSVRPEYILDDLNSAQAGWSGLSDFTSGKYRNLVQIYVDAHGCLGDDQAIADMLGISAFGL